MPICNLMTGAGFELGFMGPFGMAWLGMVILFFIIVLARKWMGEEFGMPFNTLGAFIGAYVPYVIAVSITCSFKWALAAGLVGFAIGGFGLGFFSEDGGEY